MLATGKRFSSAICKKMNTDPHPLTALMRKLILLANRLLKNPRFALAN